MNIEIKQETYDFLKNIMHEIETQDNRSTRLPILYVIKETIREYGIEEDYRTDGFEWEKDGESYTWDEIEDEINKEQQYNFMFDISSIDEDNVKEYGFEKVFYRNVERYSDNFFFTEKAAKEHIRINGHNLTKPQDYVIHAFRNDEIESVIEAIKEIVNKVEGK